MPSYSDKQARFMAADYSRAKAWKKTKTGMSAAKLKEWVEADSIGKKMKRKK